MIQPDNRHALLLAAAITLSACKGPALPVLPDISFAGIPDMPQQGPKFNPRFENETLCAPVAVANSLAWLQGISSLEAQVDMVNRLAGHRYMATSPHIGTSPGGLMHGVQRYLQERNIPYQRLEYAGYRTVPEQYRANEPVSLQWLHSGLTEHSAVWLNLGWYTQVLPGVYRREGGHWVTLAGFEEGGLLLHDPGPWQDQPVPLQITSRRNNVLLGEDWKIAPLVLELPNAPSPGRGQTMIDGAVRLLRGSHKQQPLVE